ncbi:Nucleoside transporter family protein [Perilla frutescens var. hirtella]|uniref:Nucleoside transporter family protein n=1 Tax=Perilla frutescens var. hirtella TaxID=608512 RepID=A0AAD4JJV2_PERFH|nr:Nucleoside transporter family protein [Perilla frutescens var. hirtella]
MECIDHRHRLLRFPVPRSPRGEGHLRRLHGIFVASSDSTHEFGFLSEKFEFEVEIEFRVFHVCCFSNGNSCNELDMRSSVAYYAVVVTVLICGLADGLIGGSLIGTAGKLPKQYMQAVFAGTASSGVLISILRVITKASLPQTPQGLKSSAEFYFVVSSAALVLCIISCNLLYKLPVMQQHYKDFEHILVMNNYSKLKFWKTFTQIRFPGFRVFMIYTVTLSIFPEFLAENIKSDMLKDWYPIALIATYNLSDFVGKAMTGIYVMDGIGKATWWCMARLVLYPLFVGCFRGPEWLRAEAPVVVLIVILGLSNGYLTSVIMILAPKVVAEAEVAAIFMAVLLAMGLVAGSIIGWFWII